MLVCLVLLSSTIWKEQGPESQTGNLGVKTICSKTWIGVICMVRPPVRDGTIWPPSPHRYQCGTAHAALPKAGGGVGSPRAPPSTAAGLATSTCATYVELESAKAAFQQAQFFFPTSLAHPMAAAAATAGRKWKTQLEAEEEKERAARARRQQHDSTRMLLEPTASNNNNGSSAY
mmetsp:Transcript_14835/g.24156  ORF Transcript_14835/g.24156 Transcript_14835/m.24156 type:complete len:175 (+) Transcript_14835:428-952(+)